MPVEGRGLYKKPPESHRFVESIATSGPSHSASAGPYIAEYRALNRKGSEQCLQILRRVGTLVKPLMVKHGWRLPLLAEFYPNEKNLLGINVNGGQKICLRLRAPHNPDQIWDEHVVMGCMLHELTHNVRGPHDSVFYAFLDKLKDEYQSIRISGWSGEGFLVPGRTLGRGMQQHVRQGMHTAVAAAMAEERRRRALLGLDSAPRRLGGASSSSTNMTSAQRATEAAATRRAQQDNAQCPCASAADLAQVERETNEREEREGVEIVEVRPGGREAEEDRAAADFLLQKVLWNADAGPSSIKQEVKLESTSGIKPQSASVSGKRPMSAINFSKGATQAEAITIADDSSGSSIEEGGDNLDDDIQLVATKIKRKPFQPPPPPDTRTPLQRSSEGAPSMKLLKPAMWKRLQAEADAAKSSAAAAARDKDTKAKARNQRPVASTSTSRGSGGVGVNVTGANVRSAEAAAGLALGLQAGWIGPHDLSQQASGPTRTPSSSSSSSAAAGWAGGASTEWTCQTCTLVNGALSEACVACSAPHPAILSQLFS